MPRTKHAVNVTVNGVACQIEVEPRRLLSDVIRDDLGLTGTHVGCEQGACGACTVLIDGRAARACLTFAVQVDGSSVTTIEGIAKDGQLHPIQEAFHQTHAVQCGFCTPGLVVSAFAFLADNPDPDEAEIREGLAGNFCRCTGYQNIVRAVQQAADLMSAAQGVDPGERQESRMNGQGSSQSRSPSIAEGVER